MAVSVQINDEQAQALLQRLASFVTNPSAPLRQSAQALRRLVKDTFTATTDPWGRRWARWAPATRAARLRVGGRGSILVDTGRMSDTVDATASADAIEVRVGTDYASFHQFGNPAHRAWGGKVSPLPQRAFLPVRSPGVADVPAGWWFEILLPVEAAIAKAAR